MLFSHPDLPPKINSSSCSAKPDCRFGYQWNSQREDGRPWRHGRWVAGNQPTCFIRPSPSPQASTQAIHIISRLQRIWTVAADTRASRSFPQSLFLARRLGTTNVAVQCCLLLVALGRASPSFDQSTASPTVARHASESSRLGSLSGPDVFAPDWREIELSSLHCHADDPDLVAWSHGSGPSSRSSKGYIGALLPTMSRRAVCTCHRLTSCRSPPSERAN